ncbi:hypothetical protein [Pseudoduganella buxea]|uniref:Uncharacterized protein n=1 Tax=Pseudoduganella buxea TaxID=1949069 RepID=A0A6I3T4R6_9BURK|nr:hypothetical protein [Pseudoduganella buxea]MTV56444.1 hypothetical protein [Pseudoduganella buxea]GGC25633.1 hypothetical protein GCM10011572_53760 [Pseudoduganella buxea]
MKIFLDEATWRKVVADFDITDIAVRDRNIVQLCLKTKMSNEDASQLLNEDIPSRIVTLFLDRAPGNNFGFQELQGMRYPSVGVSRAPFPRPSGLIVSRSSKGDVWPFGGGNGPMEFIAPDGGRPATRRLKCINGYTYSVGTGRRVYRRTAVGKWLRIDNGLPQTESSTAQGFSDLDAFSESDMYAVGGNGDVWHFDGAKWTQQGFPSNVELATVTCAGDGNVYISGEGGSLWVGNKSTWKRIYKGSSSILWNDVLWFQDKLWLASDYQFRQWNGKELVPVKHEGENVYITGHMDAYDGILVVASLDTVMQFDGKSWQVLVAPYPVS